MSIFWIIWITISLSPVKRYAYLVWLQVYSGFSASANPREWCSDCAFFFAAIYFCSLIVQWRQRSNRLIYIPVAIAIDSKHLVFSADGASILVILFKITHKNGVPGHSKASAQVNFRARAPVIDTLDSCCTNKYHIRKMLLHQWPVIIHSATFYIHIFWFSTHEQ